MMLPLLGRMPKNSPQVHQRRCQRSEPCTPHSEGQVDEPARCRSHSSQEKGQKVPRSDVDVIPGVPVHGFGVESPRVERAQREGNDVLEPQCDDERGVPERFHLVNLKWKPEGQRRHLDQRADSDQRQPKSPYPQTEVDHDNATAVERR